MKLALIAVLVGFACYMACPVVWAVVGAIALASIVA